MTDNVVIKTLAKIGLVRIERPHIYRSGKVVEGAPRVRWPIHVSPWWIWKVNARNVPWRPSILGNTWFGMFRNRPGVVSKEKGRWIDVVLRAHRAR